MPRNGSGTYTLPNAAFVPGTAISSADVNENFADIAAELTDSLSRTGDGGMSVPFQNTPGTEAAPGITFVGDTDTGIYRVGANVIGVSVGSNEVLEIDGTRTTIQNRSLFLDRGWVSSSVSTGAWYNSSATPADVTNATVSVTTYGQPIVVTLVPDGSSNSAYVGGFAVASTSSAVTFYVLRDSTVVGQIAVLSSNPHASADMALRLPPGSIMVLDAPVAGTYTYKLQYVADSPNAATVYYCKLVVHDL